MEKDFTSIDGLHKITVFPLTMESVLLEIHFIDFENIKTFVFLLKEVVEYLHKNKLFKVLQQIVKTDFQLFRFSKIIEDEKEDVMLIETPLDKFIPEIFNVFGIPTL